MWRPHFSHMSELEFFCRMMTRMAQTQYYADALLAELSKEMENGRLLRLLAKLCFVKERGALADDAAWGEGGDRYLLRLFADSVFQQVDDDAHPVVDLSSLVASLNKLDVGHDSRVLLSSPHDGSMLLVNYREVYIYIYNTHIHTHSDPSVTHTLFFPYMRTNLFFWSIPNPPPPSPYPINLPPYPPQSPLPPPA